MSTNRDGLFQARCTLHPGREAAVRCPGCRRDYCRECVVEHEGRLLCTHCLAGATSFSGRPSKRRWISLLRLSATVAGVVWTWLVFFALGELLARLPDETLLDLGSLP